jgi:glutamate-ammonia-ligase adenylyltransferase
LNALALWQTVQGLLRLTLEGEFVPESAPAGLKAALARAAQAQDFKDLEATIRAGAGAVVEIFTRLIPTGS